MKPELNRVRELLRKTIAIMCQNSLLYKKDMKIEGLLGITLDDQDILLVHINEAFPTLDADEVGAGQTDSIVDQDGSRPEERLDRRDVDVVEGCSLRNDRSTSHPSPRVCSSRSQILPSNSEARACRRRRTSPNPKIDVSVVDGEEKKQSSQASSLQTQASNPQSQASNPQIQASNPQIQASNPQIEASNPQIQASNPQIQASNPQIEASNPQIQASNPQIEASNPQIQISGPQTQVFNPQNQVFNPQTQAGNPQVEIFNPQIQAAVPQVQVSGPQIQATNPQAQIFDLQRQQSDQIEAFGQESRSFVPGNPAFTSQVPALSTSGIEQCIIPITSPTLCKQGVVPADIQVEDGRGRAKTTVDFVDLCGDEVTERRNDDADIILMKQSYMNDAKKCPAADRQTEPGTVKTASQSLQDSSEPVRSSADPSAAPPCGDKMERQPRSGGRRASCPADKPSRCEVCGKSYWSRNSMLRHRKSHDPSLLMCRKCTLFFHSEQALLSHQIVRHKQDGKYTCRICKRNLRYKHQYLLHLRIEHQTVSDR